MSPSQGLLVAPLGDETAVYDLVTDRVVIVDRVAGWLLQAAAEPIERLVAEAVGVTGASPERVEADIRVGIEELADVGLMNRPDPFPPLVPLTGCPLDDDDRLVGATQEVSVNFPVIAVSEQSI